MKRRTQQYGALFCFQTRKLLVDESSGSKKPIKTEIPKFLHELLQKINTTFGSQFNFVTVNEYELGQGIMPHKDAALFGPVILSLGLLADCVMEFSLEKGSRSPYCVFFPRRSLLQMSESSRTDYFHGISKQNFGKETLQNNRETQNHSNRRISIVFRTIENLE